MDLQKYYDIVIVDVLSYMMNIILYNYSKSIFWLVYK